MTKQNKTRPLRQLVCEGCFRQCRYEDFRAHGPHAGGFAPKAARDYKAAYRREQQLKLEALPHGNTGKHHTGQQIFAEAKQDLYVQTQDSSKWRYRRKGTVLGSLHATKMAMWEEFTGKCPLYGSEE